MTRPGDPRDPLTVPEDDMCSDCGKPLTVGDPGPIGTTPIRTPGPGLGGCVLIIALSGAIVAAVVLAVMT